MRFHPGLDLGLMTAAAAPPPIPPTRTSRGSRVVHPDHIPGAAVVFVDDSAGSDAWTAEVEAVTRAGFCAVLLERASPASGEDEDPRAYAEDLAELLDRLEHETTTVVGRDQGAAGVVRFLASAPGAAVDHAVLVGLVLPAGTETGEVVAAERLLAELHRIRIPVFVARGTDESQSVDDFASQLRALLPDRCMVRTYARRRSELTQPRHDAFLTDLLDFLGDSAPVRLPRVDLPNTVPTTDTTELDS